MILRDFLLKVNKSEEYVYNAFTVLYANFTVSLDSSIIHKIVAFPALSIFLVKLICSIAFVSLSRTSCLLGSIAIRL